MTTKNYVDFEKAALGEFSSVVTSGGATLAALPEAAFPGRGWLGGRLVKPAGTGTLAYACKTHSAAPAAGRWLRIFCRVRLNSFAGGSAATACSLLDLRDTTSPGYNLLWLLIDRDGRLLVRTYDDAAAAFDTPAFAPEPGRWYTAAVELRRASGATANDGLARLRIDGELVGQTALMDNYDRAGRTSSWLIAGQYVSSADGAASADLDEIHHLQDSPANPKVGAAGCPAKAGQLAGFGRVGCPTRRSEL